MLVQYGRCWQLRKQHDIERARDDRAGDRRHGVEVGEAGHKDTVATRREVRRGAATDGVERCIARCKRTQQHIGARVDEQARPRRSPDRLDFFE